MPGSFTTTTMSVGSNASNMSAGVDGMFDHGGGPDVPFDVGAPMFQKGLTRFQVALRQTMALTGTIAGDRWCRTSGRAH